MRFHFSLVLKGEDSIENKFQEVVKSYPNLHIDLVKAFGHAIMMAFRFTPEDNIVIENFNAGKVMEAPPPRTPPENSEKIVDEQTNL